MAKNYSNQSNASSGKKPGKTWDPDAEMKRRREAAAARKEAARKEAERNERDTNYRNATRPEPGKTKFVKPAATQKPTTTTKYTGSKPGPTGPSSSQTKEARERQSSYDYVSRTSKRKNEEEQLEAKRKKAEWNKSQQNNSVGYKNMIKRREQAQKKKIEEKFGRFNRGWW